MPPTPLLWLVVFVDAPSSCFAENLLVRWCLGVVSMTPVLQFTVIWEPDAVSFRARNVSWACLWHPLGHLVRSGALGITRKEALGSRFGFLSILVRFRERILRVVSFHVSPQVTVFLDFGV